MDLYCSMVLCPKKTVFMDRAYVITHLRKPIVLKCVQWRHFLCLIAVTLLPSRVAISVYGN